MRHLWDAEEGGEPSEHIVDVVLTAIARLARQLAVYVEGGMRAASAHDEAVFDHVVEFLEHDDVLEAARELVGRVGGEGVGGSHLPEAVGGHGHAPLRAKLLQARKRLACVSSGNAAGGHAELRGRGELGGRGGGTAFRLRVKAGKRLVSCVVLRDACKALVDFPVRFKRATGEDDPTRVALEALFGEGQRVGFIRHLEERRRMADARRRTHDDGRFVLLGKLERGLHHGETLLGRGGVEHGYLRERPEAAGVLLGLRGDGAGIVGHIEHAAALDSDVVQAHERVGSDIEANLLAGEKRARPTVGRAREQF